MVMSLECGIRVSPGAGVHDLQRPGDISEVQALGRQQSVL